MPLATKIEITKAKLLEETRRIAVNAGGIADSLNRQTALLLDLNNAELTAFLQGQGADLPALLQAHKDRCDEINAALTSANATLAAAGQDTIAKTADGSPLADKLAAQGRAIDMQTLIVSNI